MDYTQFDRFLGNSLYEARVVQRLTQEDVAKAISKELKKHGKAKGITRSAYSFYENGERSMPTDVFSYACEFLGLNENEIFNKACDHAKRKQPNTTK